MNIQSFLFASKLAWKQLIHEKTKLIAAVLGVMFATVLIFMQLGFRDSLFESAARAPQHLSGDLFLIHKQTEAMWRTHSFDRSELMRALASFNVKSVNPLYTAQVPFKNPVTKEKNTIMMYGFDPYADIFAKEKIAPFREQLIQSDKVIFDSASRPDFGPIKSLLKNGRLFTEISDRRVEIVNTILLGTSFGSDGNIATSDLNFLRIVGGRDQSLIDIGIITLKDKSKLQHTKHELRSLLNDNVILFDHDELNEFELHYWKHKAPIGFIFGFGMLMGMIVGMVIVYQILFTDITNHLSEYATLKAIGYNNLYLIQVVFAQSLYLCLLGFFPGAIASKFFYHISEANTFIPMPMPIDKIIQVFFMIIGMCFASGLLAIKKLKSANPADMF
jgi:putative ABC transport system permease protein